jgi:enoyl-CoA hydratase/carnithine racemase
MMPFVNLGIVPEAGSTILLPLLAGYQRAADVLMLCEPFTAERGYEIGLINAVVAPDALLHIAMETARKLVEKPRGALLACKQLMKRASGREVHRAIAEEVAVIAERLDSPETREALTAFLEKRKPDFSALK